MSVFPTSPWPAVDQQKRLVVGERVIYPARCWICCRPLGVLPAHHRARILLVGPHTYCPRAGCLPSKNEEPGGVSWGGIGSWLSNLDPRSDSYVEAMIYVARVAEALGEHQRVLGPYGADPGAVHRACRTLDTSRHWHTLADAAKALLVTTQSAKRLLDVEGGDLIDTVDVAAVVGSHEHCSALLRRRKLSAEFREVLRHISNDELRDRWPELRRVTGEDPWRGQC